MACGARTLVVSRSGLSSLRGLELGEDPVGGLGPGERMGLFVPVVDVGLDGGDEVVDGGEGPAADGLGG